MFPIILVSNKKSQITKEIKKILKKEKISSNKYFEFLPDGTIIKIEQIREIIKFVKNLSNTKTAIAIYDFDTAKEETQNTFLKTLEEKNINCQFILVVSNVSLLLPTIISRSNVKKVVDESLIEKVKDEVDLLSGDYYQDLKKYDSLTKEKVILVLDKLLIHFRNELKLNKKIELKNIIKKIFETRKLIIKNNINPQLAIDHVLYSIYLSR